jgi:hypothetical protein
MLDSTMLDSTMLDCAIRLIGTVCDKTSQTGYPLVSALPNLDKIQEISQIVTNRQKSTKIRNFHKFSQIAKFNKI